jgi:hypothetical protein
MRLLSKTALLLLILLFLAPIMPTVHPSNAPPIPTPAIPKYSLEYSDTFAYYPSITTYSTNPYNGNTTSTTIPERYIENRAVNITIKNEPYPAIINGYPTNLYYNFRVKPHFGDFWVTEGFTYFPMNDTSGIVGAGDFYLWAPSDSENTTIQYSVSSLQAGDAIDIQVEAVWGYNYTILTSIGNIALSTRNSTVFTYQTSGWSNTQTITIPVPETAVPSSPTYMFLVVAILLLTVLVLAIAVLVKHKQTKGKSKQKITSSAAVSARLQSRVKQPRQPSKTQTLQMHWSLH